MQLKPSDACPRCGSRSSEPPEYRSFRYRRRPYRTCDSCGKWFAVPTIPGSVGFIVAGAIFIAAMVWLNFQNGFAPGILSPRIASITRLGFGLLIGSSWIWMGIWGLLRCIKTREESFRGFQVVQAPSELQGRAAEADHPS